ncbi:hypothetical protein NNRS527_00419 [Nitrosospira sp. NRS527]|nr:hypothetical protein NNRS527_00419 [Nitrosospira sp. NRS527]
MANPPLLTVTNPWLLWLFLHGWEGDPGWGKSHAGQVAIATAIHELANQVEDAEARKQIQAVAAKSIARSGEKLSAGL